MYELHFKEPTHNEAQSNEECTISRIQLINGRAKGSCWVSLHVSPLPTDLPQLLLLFTHIQVLIGTIMLFSLKWRILELFCSKVSSMRTPFLHWMFISKDIKQRIVTFNLTEKLAYLKGISFSLLLGYSLKPRVRVIILSRDNTPYVTPESRRGAVVTDSLRVFPLKHCTRN